MVRLDAVQRTSNLEKSWFSYLLNRRELRGAALLRWGASNLVGDKDTCNPIPYE